MNVLESMTSHFHNTYQCYNHTEHHITDIMAMYIQII